MFVVVESCEDYIQPLVLRKGEAFPPQGILGWQEGKEPFAVFATKALARAAIRRTGHYAKAWEQDEYQWPKPKFCVIDKAQLIEPDDGKVRQ